MADNKGNDGELKISELSDQLKNKYSEESKASEPKIKTGYIARYAKLVSSADRGAILTV